MDYKKKYFELLDENRKLTLAIELLHEKNQPKPDIAREMIFKVFHSASHLMAISKLDTGNYVDVNDSFLNALGYTKEEIIGHTSDDIQIFAGFEESNKYIKLISKLKKVRDFEVTLKSKNGVEKPYLFSAETVQLSDEVYLLTIYNEVPSPDGSNFNDSQSTILAEIFDTVSSYLTLYRISEDNRFYILDLSKKVEDVELITKASVVGKCIDDTPLSEREKLNELLHYLRITGDAHKLAASPSGDDSEGYYMGFVLTTGKIVITWEPGASPETNDKGHDSRELSSRVKLQKEHEEQLRREKVFLEHLIDSAPEAIAITDKNGIITLINKEFTNLFGFTPEEADGCFIDDLVVPEDFKDEAITLEKLASDNHRQLRNTVRKDKFGKRIKVTLIATTVFDADKFVAYIGIYRDISVETKSQLFQEILFNISTAALKQTEVKDIYPIIVHEVSKIWDTNNFFIGLYDKSTETFSLPYFADENDNFTVIPANKTLSGWVVKNNKSVLLRTEDLKNLDDSGEVELLGTSCRVWMGVPLRIEKKVIGVMCLQDYNDENKFKQDDLYVLEFIANQITIAMQRRKMLDDLIVARQKAEMAAQSKQLFMSTMSHEIRTPLNEVIGITNLLLQGKPREDQMDYIKTLKFSGNHLLTLVNDVLDYNKMESGKIVFEQISFNLYDFLDEIVRSYSLRAKVKNLSFELIKESRLPKEVIGDPIRLNQILSNLLSNALKFTTQGGITVNVNEIKNIRNMSTLEFSVTDTGIGIPSDKHASIFDSYTQASTDTTRHFGGTGLGLSICQKLVDLQGGRISVVSEMGKGSTFMFELTFKIPETDKNAPAASASDSFTGLEGKRILVAEDNKINFYVANKFLTGWGMIVTHVDTGQAVLDFLEKEDFDLILMDLHMPVMDGIEATRIIRASGVERIKTIPVVALTAAIMSESHDKIDGLIINDYVLKPFKPHELFDRIKRNIR